MVIFFRYPLHIRECKSTYYIINEPIFLSFLGKSTQIAQVKLQWNAKPKVGSLDNATYKPGGGDKKIETVKLDFKDKAKPKVGSKDNAKHVPGGGSVKVRFLFF